jgi:hypothetical protein
MINDPLMSEIPPDISGNNDLEKVESETVSRLSENSGRKG